MILKNAYQDNQLANDIQALVRLSIKGNLIVHELQKERGTTSGFVGSNGKSFANKMQQQRQATDTILQATALNEAITERLRSAYPQVTQSMQSVLRGLERLPELRKQVDALSLSAAQAAQFYTDLNTSLLALSGTIADMSTYGQLTSKLRNYYTFLQAKEAAGKERALLNIALSNDAFNPGAYQKFVTLESYQNAYLTSFEQFASPSQLQQLENLRSSPAGKRVKAIRAIANDKFVTGNFGVSGPEWFDAATDRINQMKALEDGLAQEASTMVQSIHSQAQRFIYFSLIFIGVLIIITTVLCVYVARLLIHQTMSLANTINTVSQTKDLTLQADVNSTDELGRSAQGFNDMLAIIRHMLKQITDSSVQLSAAAEQTSISIAENTNSLEKQSLETSQAATATEEMTATVNEIATNTTHTADAANEASQLSHNGMDIVESNAQNMNTLHEQMSGANTQVIELRDASQEINNIVDVIKGIAEQTNLLALNAAIEAARAGEQGRGFAVVADEVRSLAQRTQKSTQQIADMVARFQSEAGQVSEIIEASFEHVKHSSQQTHSVKENLEAINRAIDSITDMCNQVSAAANQQVAATNEIAINIRTINDLADVSAETSKQITLAAKEQAQLSSQQHELVAQFKL
ncbi:methyl-accepting chemotaxis protein [Vibrio zhugei]|nr:methyl-accepting chemotaxis protein [Vibrio zhugei]